MNLLSFTSKSLENLTPFIFFFIILFAGYIIRSILFKRLGQWAKKTNSRIDDIIIETIHGPIMLWFGILGIFMAIKTSVLPTNFVDILEKVLQILWIASITLAVNNLLVKLVRMFSSSIESTLPVTSLTQNLVRIIVFSVGILIGLNSLGISIAPILATLGVGGLAVALGLQDTLSNLFSGFHVSMTKQIRVGDYIKIESGEEGYITDIDWRLTKLQMLPNNVILIPNSKLAQSIVTNYHLPDKEMIVTIDLGVHYNSDLEKVEQCTLDVAKSVMKNVVGGVPDFEPVVRFHTFADSSINFTVAMRCREFTEQRLIKHEFIKRLVIRYQKEGIVIPYPIRAINYSQEKAISGQL